MQLRWTECASLWWARGECLYFSLQLRLWLKPSEMFKCSPGPCSAVTHLSSPPLLVMCIWTMWPQGKIMHLQYSTCIPSAWMCSSLFKIVWITQCSFRSRRGKCLNKECSNMSLKGPDRCPWGGKGCNEGEGGLNGFGPGDGPHALPTFEEAWKDQYSSTCLIYLVWWDIFSLEYQDANSHVLT